MENTIMTEKITRRGVKTPESFEPDILEKITAREVMEKNGLIISDDNSIGEVTDWLIGEPEYNRNYFIVASTTGEYRGILSSSNLFNKIHKADTLVATLVKRKNISVTVNTSLRTAVALMAAEDIDVLPVVNKENNNVIGTLSYQNIIASYRQSIDEHKKKHPGISIKRRSLKILIKGQKLVSSWKTKGQ